MDMTEPTPDWPELRWDEAVDRVSKCVFRICAGTSAGTGFLLSIGRNAKTGDSYATIATAWHVIEPLIGTSEDLKIESVDGKTVFSSAADQIGFYPLGEP